MAETRILKQPFDPWIDNDCRVLILGSFPSVLAVKNDFYYGNPHNRFYEVMGRLLNLDLKAMDKDAKKASLLARHLAVYDIVASCRIEGSSDASISDVKIADIGRLIKGTSIKHIFLNGKTAAGYFSKSHPDLIGMATTLPSTSPANARSSIERLIEDWGALLDYLSE
jgi:hypoxanthine-DNA glycosylase